MGATDIEPFGSRLDPTPGLMVTLSASIVVQVKVVAFPTMMVAGSAVNVISGGSSIVTVTLDVAVPPGPVAVMV